MSPDLEQLEQLLADSGVRVLARVLTQLAQRPEVVAAVRGALAAPVTVEEHSNALLSKKTLASKLKVSTATIDRMAAEGMPHTYCGDARRFDMVEVRAWLATRGKRPTKAKQSEREVDISDVVAGAGLRPST